MKAAAIYVRISSDREGTRAGVSRQLQDCKEWAERHDSTWVEIYEDNDLSAYRGKLRPAYKRMCEHIKDGTRDGVIAWHPDRLHRNLREIEDFIDLIDATGAEVATVTGGDYDLSTSTGRGILRISGVFARMESEDKSRRITRSAKQQALEGRRSGGGTRGYGYNADHSQIVEAEAAIITEAASRILAGDTLRSVCSDLNDRHVPTVSGATWSTTVLRTMLTSGRISGQREHHGELVAAGKWPAIVPPTTTARLRKLLLDPNRRTNRAPRSYPLTGLVFCGKCGAKMVARPKSDGRRQYVCAKGPGFHGCGGCTILAEPLETLIAEAILIRLDSPVTHHAIKHGVTSEDDADRLMVDIASAKDQLEQLALMWSRKEISVREWSAARKSLDDQIKIAEKGVGALLQSSALDGFIGNADTLRGQWSDLAAARQGAIAAVLLDRITIGPAVRGRNRFDPSRIDATWRV